MGNEVRGVYDLPAGKKTYKLKFGFNELIEFGEATGRSLMDLAHEDLRDWEKLKLYRTAVWIGLRKQHPELTEEEVGDIITYEAGYRVTQELIMKVILATFQGAGAEDPAKPGTGKSKKNRKPDKGEDEKNAIPQNSDGSSIS